MAWLAHSIEHLSRHLADANHRRQRLDECDLSPLNRIVQYTPEDMTVTVQAGRTLASLQRELAAHRQWLPVDPPHPEQVTLADLVQRNLHGPHRFGYGTLRDHLIGLRVALPDGRIVRSGGQVVKNVAGYDLPKLFVGSQGTLGLVVEATFKLMPLPHAEQFHARSAPDPMAAAPLIRSILDSHISPVVLDLCPAPEHGCRVVVGISGSTEQVQWQQDQCERLGFTEPADLSHESAFWNPALTDSVHQWSLPPTRLAESVASLPTRHWVARAGNGLLLYRGHRPPPPATLPHRLMQRVKSTFDPHGILPDVPW